MASLPDKLLDVPAFTISKWQGYFRKIDPTLQPINSLTFPSINCSIPMGDKIVPDAGKTLLGQSWTEVSGMIGNKEKFKNLGGIEMEVRVWRSYATPAKGDVIEVLYNGLWHQITENNNPLPLGAHEYYFDDWWDSNIDSSLSRNLPRLIWVNGYSDLYTLGGEIYSWTGGIVEIDSLTPTTLTIAGGISWRSLGFTEIANGNAFIVVNGVSYQLTNPADLDTDTISLASTAGISAGDIATQIIEVDQSPIPFDMCRENKGYMFYGNWNYRSLYMSNAFNRPAELKNQTYNSRSGLNDALFTGTFTGTTEEKIEVTIDQAAGNIVYSGNGSNLLGFDFTNYNGTGHNKYRVTIWQQIDNTGNYIWLYMSYKNDVPVFGPVPFQDPATGQGGFPGGITTTFPVADLITFFVAVEVQGNLTPAGAGPYTAYSGSFTQGDTYTFEIADTFSWSLNGVPQQTNIAIGGGTSNPTTPIALGSTGISVSFQSLVGHEIGDTWSVTGFPEIDRAWANFYYAVPIRRPGEGYIYQLPSNFWTMDTQEEQMYVNDSYGNWSFVETELSADLQSESVTLQPLKQAGSNKVLYPYLTGHFGNMLVYVTVDHNLDYIGRLQLLEKPQIANLSDPVDLDFKEASFIGGRIKFLDKKLYITSPNESVMFCYDDIEKYWQPPKVYSENGILSIVGNELITHSNLRNQSFTLLKGTSDNGQPYTVRIRTPYTSFGEEYRWVRKVSNMSFTEGYIEGLPPLIHRLYLGINGCNGIYPHQIEPIVCTPEDRAPFGEGNFGSHAFGSDVYQVGNYFQEIYKKYSPTLDYYFISFEIECTTVSHTWSILSLGVNGRLSNKANTQLTNPSNVVPNNP